MAQKVQEKAKAVYEASKDVAKNVVNESANAVIEATIGIPNYYNGGNADAVPMRDYSKSKTHDEVYGVTRTPTVSHAYAKNPYLVMPLA